MQSVVPGEKDNGQKLAISGVCMYVFVSSRVESYRVVLGYQESLAIRMIPKRDDDGGGGDDVVTDAELCLSTFFCL